VLDRAHKHIHNATQDGCTDLCVCAKGTQQPSYNIFANDTIAQRQMGFFSLTPQQDVACGPTAPLFKPAAGISWRDMVSAGHDAWAERMRQVRCRHLQARTWSRLSLTA